MAKVSKQALVSESEETTDSNISVLGKHLIREAVNVFRAVSDFARGTKLRTGPSVLISAIMFVVRGTQKIINQNS